MHQQFFPLKQAVQYSIPLMLHLNRVRQISALDEFDAELKKVALSTFFYAIIMALTF